jgi:hypothetical protein
MVDAVLIVLIVAFFLACLGYVALCERLGG